MTRCEMCGYYWADCSEDGRTIGNAYCHYEGPDAWAPCEQDEMTPYEEYDPDDEYDPEAETELWLESEMDRSFGWGWR